MLRIFLAILAAGILACDDVTGPTPDGGEVALELWRQEDERYLYKWAGEGYIFATGEKFLLTRENNDISRKLDIVVMPGRSSNPDVMIYASGKYRGYYRISWYKGHAMPISHFYIGPGESADFELVTLDGKARYKIAVSCKYQGFDEKRSSKVYKIFMRYKIKNT